jgi:hypothetical protein
MVMPVTVWNQGTLTGNKRVRKGWFGKIILQVEIEQIKFHPGLGEAIRSGNLLNTRRIWRDATAADVGLETVPLSLTTN